MKSFYRVHEFAQLAGVTPKALYHYDRLGLLKPLRSEAGYRVYTPRDLNRLEQIVALKFIGVPLVEIKRLLDRGALGMAQALRLQRRVLEQKRRFLDHALKAIAEAEDAIAHSGPEDAPASQAIRKLIEVIGMQNQTDFLKKYYSEEAWAKWRAADREWPSPEMVELLMDAQQAVGEDPDSEKAQSLAMRWVHLRVREATGDPAAYVALTKAWIARKDWPVEIAAKFAGLDLESVLRFLHRAVAGYRRQYYTDAAWEKLMREPPEETERKSIEWFDMFLEAGSLLETDPAGDRAQDLVARWMDLFHRSTDGDLERRAGAMKAWADRQNWPPAIREEIASFNLERIMKLIGEAYAASEKKYYSGTAWGMRRQLPEQSKRDMGARWSNLYGQVREALNDDPGSERAQSLAQSWMELIEETTGGDPELKLGAIRSWQDRQNWPAWKQRQIEASQAGEISHFIGRAIDWPQRKYYGQQAWEKKIERWKALAPEALEQALSRRPALFAEVRAVWDQDPAGEPAQAIAGRWLELRQGEAGGDPELLAGGANAWADRQNWPLALRLKESTTYAMTLEDFEKAAAFIDAAVAGRR